MPHGHGRGAVVHGVGVAHLREWEKGSLCGIGFSTRKKNTLSRAKKVYNEFFLTRELKQRGELIFFLL